VLRLRAPRPLGAPAACRGSSLAQRRARMCRGPATAAASSLHRDSGRSARAGWASLLGASQPPSAGVCMRAFYLPRAPVITFLGHHAGMRTSRTASFQPHRIPFTRARRSQGWRPLDCDLAAYIARTGGVRSALVSAFRQPGITGIPRRARLGDGGPLSLATRARRAPGGSTLAGTGRWPQLGPHARALPRPALLDQRPPEPSGLVPVAPARPCPAWPGAAFGGCSCGRCRCRHAWPSLPG